MRKRLKTILPLFLLLSLLLTAIPASAEKNLTSEGTAMQITLQQDGSAHITEQWDYYYSGDPITRYSREYLLPHPYVITDLSVSLDGQTLQKLDGPDESRPLGCFAAYWSNDRFCIDVYQNSQNVSRSIRIDYVLQNAVTVYDDIAQFKWDLSSNNEAVPIRELTAAVSIPAGASMEDVRIWAHGPENGTFLKTSDTRYDLQVTDVPSDRGVSIRMAMPVSLFADCVNRQSGNQLDTILKEEGAAQTQQTVHSVLIALLALFILLLAVGVLILMPVNAFIVRSRLLKQNRVSIPDPPQYYRTLPSNDPPALITKLYTFYKKNSLKKNTAFTATVLDMTMKKMLAVEQQGKQVFLSVLPYDGEIYPHEQIILEMILTAKGDAPSITVKQLNAYMQQNPKWGQQKYKAFETAVNEAFATGYPSRLVTKKWLSFRWLWLLFIPLVLCLGGVGIYAGEFVLGIGTALLGCLAIGVCWNAFNNQFSCLEETGEKQWALWQAFGRFLDDFTTFDEKELPDFKVWRSYLSYACAIGKSDKVIKQLKVLYPTPPDEWTDDNFTAIVYSSILFHELSGFSRNASTITPAANISGAGGGFTGGGSFGGGAGGSSFD